MKSAATPTRVLRVNWDAYAKVYDSLTALTPYRELMEHAAALVAPTPDMHILDAGSGTGNATAAILALARWSERKPTVIGIDRSHEMLEIARAKCGLAAMFEHADLDAALPYARETFDAIVCVNALYAVEDPLRTLREFARVLREDGALVIATPKRGYENGLVLKAHAKDHGEDAPWLGAHASPEREHTLISRTFPDDPTVARAMSAIARHNRAIAQDARFHFFDAREFAALAQEAGFVIDALESTYADQCHLARLFHVAKPASRSAT